MAQKINIRLSGRKELAHTDFNYEILKSQNPQSTTPILKLNGVNETHGLPEDSVILVRLKDLRDYRNFECGSLSAPKSPPEDALKNFKRESYQVSFRIVGKSGASKGKILGSSVQKKVETEDFSNTSSGLLPFGTQDLGSLLWKLEIDDENGPFIYVNSRVRGISNMFREDKLLLSAIFPNVIKEIFQNVYMDGNPPLLTPDWKERWSTWGSRFNEDQLARNPDPCELKEWIESLIENFMEHHAFVDHLIQDTTNED